MATPKALAVQMLAILDHDRDHHLERVDEYLRGIQDDPYMPESADAEYRMLARRAVTNVMPFIVNTPTQAMYVDSFRRGHQANEEPLPTKEMAVSPEWEHWQYSRLDARQHAIYRGAFGHGHSFALTELDTNKKVKTKGLSAMRTAAVYDDPANDIDPTAALTVTKWPKKEQAGTARMWDDTLEYKVTFKSLTDAKTITVQEVGPHGAAECPVTRFHAAVDLDGRTVGVVEPMIPIQNRINQTVFDMLIVQSYASFKVRTVSGMAPPTKLIPVDKDGNEVLNPDSAAGRLLIEDWVPLIVNGRPVPDDVNLSAKRFLFAEDEDTKFGTLDETPLDGFIKSIEMSFRHMAALSQTPPHHILGEIANLSAEALTAAETALSRKVDEFKASFGESWERVFRVAAQIGNYDGSEDYSGEVIWRDMEQVALAQAADALGKLADQLGIPKRGLWNRVPGVTANELATWEDLLDSEPENAIADALTRSSSRPSLESAQPDYTNGPAVIGPDLSGSTG